MLSSLGQILDIHKEVLGILQGSGKGGHKPDGGMSIVGFAPDLIGTQLIQLGKQIIRDNGENLVGGGVYQHGDAQIFQPTLEVLGYIHGVLAQLEIEPTRHPAAS